MSNPFFRPQTMPGPFGNMQAMMQQFNQFRQGFRGDPQQTVQHMLQSGQITQAQFDQARAMAQQFGQFIK